ncbi:hypothetical protein WU85_04540 [Corynebacterium striatum]|nr:hypothetical protein WU85_04540 [Corynebacterium striatum]
MESLRPAVDLLSQVDGHGATLLHAGILHQVARAAHVAQAGHGGQAGVVLAGTLGDELLDDSVDARCRDIEVAAARSQGLGKVLWVLRRGDHDDDRALRRLLNSLEKRVGGLVAEAIGLIEDDHAPRRHTGKAGGAADHLAGLAHGDELFLGVHVDQVGVFLLLEYATAGLALAAARVPIFVSASAHQRSREAERSQGPSSTRRAREQPRVAHGTRVPLPAGCPRGGQDCVGHRRGICQSLRNASGIHSP